MEDSKINILEKAKTYRCGFFCLTRDNEDKFRPRFHGYREIFEGQNLRGSTFRLERFSYDLEMKRREQNRNNKRTEIERFDWFIERIQNCAWLLVG